MSLDDLDRRILYQASSGLPLVAQPFRAVAERVGCAEAEVVDRLARLRREGYIKRLGLVVRHRELGYRANAMVVWDVPDERVDEVGARLAARAEVALCYRRPRRPPAWPYNLFCMIYGTERAGVLATLASLVRSEDLGDLPHEVLFSRRAYKQTGGRYVAERYGEAGVGRP